MSLVQLFKASSLKNYTSNFNGLVGREGLKSKNSVSEKFIFTFDKH